MRKWAAIVASFFLIGTSVLVGVAVPQQKEQAQQTQEKKPVAPAAPDRAQTKPSDRTQEKPADSAPDKRDYSQEPFVFEQYYTGARFEKDGTGRRELNIRVRVHSEAGVQQLGQLIFGYNSANERMETGYVRVRKADGSVVTAPPDAMQDLSGPITREAPVYTDYRQKHITVPGLRPGEVLEYQMVTLVHTPLAPSHFWLEHDFIKAFVVLDERLEVNIPREITIQLKTQPGVEPAITEANGRRTYLWKTANLEREDEDDPGATKKKKKKSRKPEPPSVQLTTFGSWEEVGHWYAWLERERIKPSGEVRAKAAELVGERKSDLEKIEALYDYVAKNFRYVSLSFGLGRYQPHAAAHVLANQYGDCKDKHTLLAALLEAAGLRSYPVLIHSSRKIDADVPAPSQFDHVISAIPLGNETLWLDTTTEVAPFRLLSANLRNKKALLVRPDGAARLVDTPADPPFPATQRVEVEGQVNDLGKLTAKVRYTLRGDAELILRVAFRRTPKSHWKQLAQLVAFSDGLRGEVTEVNASDPAATREPFQLEYQVTLPNYLDWTSKKAQVGLPLPGMGLPQANPDDEEDTEPIELGTPIEVTTRLKLELPAKYSARAPVAVWVARDYADYRATYKVQGAAVTAERTLRFRWRELSAPRARDLVAFTRAVRTDEGQLVAVESAAAGPPVIPETLKADELHEAGVNSLENGDFRTAEDLFRRVLEKEPQHKRAWNNLGRAYLGLQESSKAIEAFRKQIEINPYDEYAYNNLGAAFWQQQKYQEAAEAFQKQVEVNPLDKRAHASLGTLYREWRKYAEAIPELEKAISLTPDDALLHVNLGQCYLNLGEKDQALAAFDKALEIAPAPTVFNNVAYELSLHRVHLDRAQQYAESAIAQTAAGLRNLTLDRVTIGDLGRVSSLAAYWDTLGWVHFQRGDLDQAEKYVAAAWLLDQHGEVGDHLAQIHEQRGRKEEAIRTYALAMAATRPVPETRGRLAKLVGGENKIEPLLAKAREDLLALRSVRLGRLLPEKEKAEAEFFVLIGPGPRVDAVKFIHGSEKLRGFGEALRGANYPVVFPDTTPTKLVRRGVLACSEAGDCVFTMVTPDNVTSVN